MMYGNSLLISVLLFVMCNFISCTRITNNHKNYKNFAGDWELILEDTLKYKLPFNPGKLPSRFYFQDDTVKFVLNVDSTGYIIYGTDSVWVNFTFQKDMIRFKRYDEIEYLKIEEKGDSLLYILFDEEKRRQMIKIN